MMVEPRKIADGYLIALNTSIYGWGESRRTPLEANTEGERQTTRWRTDKTVAHVTEHRRAVELRSRARNVVDRHCAFCGFCFLCRDDRLEKLQNDMQALQEEIKAFNETAISPTRVSVIMLVGKLARDDAATIAVVRADVDSLLVAIKDAAANGDVEAMRAAAKKLRRDSIKMLTPALEADIGATIDKVQKAAKKLTKAADTAAARVDADVIAEIESRRLSVLDLDPIAIAPVAAVVSDARQLDLSDAPTVPPDTGAKSKKPRQRKAETRPLDIEEAS
jgi:hypothetical protein